MIALDAADLVVIAGRTLGIGTDAALDQMDIAAAQEALAEARPPGREPGREFPARTSSTPAAAATAGVELVRALLRHPPFPARAQPVAVAAGLQFLSLNGWRADLDPPTTAVVVIEALASGQLSAADAAAWLEPRLTPARRVGLTPARRTVGSTGRAPVARSRSGRRPAALPAARVPAGRVAAGALLTVAVTGFTLLAAACSRGPAMPASPAGGVSVVQPSPGSASAPPDSDYAACMRAHGVAGSAYPSVSDVAGIASVTGVGLDSPQFRAAEVACRP